MFSQNLFLVIDHFELRFQIRVEPALQFVPAIDRELDERTPLP